MTTQIFRYMIAADGEPHDFLLSGPIVADTATCPVCAGN